MLSLYIMLCASVVAIITAVYIFIWSDRPAQWVRTTFTIALCIVLAGSALCTILAGDFNRDVDILCEAYDELMLYYSTVENSTNEYIRYDYYDKVMSFNAAYDRISTMSEDSLFEWLYSDEWNANLNRINFQLHGDGYGG